MTLPNHVVFPKNPSFFHLAAFFLRWQMEEPGRGLDTFELHFLDHFGERNQQHGTVPRNADGSYTADVWNPCAGLPLREKKVEAAKMVKVAFLRLRVDVMEQRLPRELGKVADAVIKEGAGLLHKGGSSVFGTEVANRLPDLLAAELLEAEELPDPPLPVAPGEDPVDTPLQRRGKIVAGFCMMHLSVIRELLKEKPDTRDPFDLELIIKLLAARGETPLERIQLKQALHADSVKSLFHLASHRRAMKSAKENLASVVIYKRDIIGVEIEHGRPVFQVHPETIIAVGFSSSTHFVAAVRATQAVRPDIIVQLGKNDHSVLVVAEGGIKIAHVAAELRFADAMKRGFDHLPALLGTTQRGLAGVDDAPEHPAVFALSDGQNRVTNLEQGCTNSSLTRQEIETRILQTLDVSMSPVVALKTRADAGEDIIAADVEDVCSF